MYMFLNREKSETNDFAIKKYLVVKEKYVENFNISRNNVTLLVDTHTKKF